jgi:drug/metabolite transporter (DMT)-like permease
MPVVLGLVSAVVWGTADFLGGASARRSPATAVVLGSQLTGLLLATPFVVVGIGTEVVGRDGLLGAVAGVVGGSALILFYRGLALGRMGMVAPLSALVTAGLPVAWGVVAQRDRPGGVAVAGIVVALVAVVLVTREPSDAGDRTAASRRGALLGAASGVGFGVVFICFSEVDAASGLWPVFMARVAWVPLLAVALSVGGRGLLPAAPDRAAVVSAGMLDFGANTAFVFAAHRGLTSVVAPVASLYPAATVLLARFVLDERLQRHQVAGLLLALVGLVLLGVA